MHIVLFRPRIAGTGEVRPNDPHNFTPWRALGMFAEWLSRQAWIKDYEAAERRYWPKNRNTHG